MQNKLKEIKDLNISEGSRIILRVDFNVPVNDAGEILNTYRIDEALPTIKMLQNLNTKIILLAHKEKGTLKSIAKYLETRINYFKFLQDNEVVNSSVAKLVSEMKNGEIVLLENLRMNEGEKNGDLEKRDEFGKKLAELGDMYVNEAFSASHRDHASITSIPKFIPGAFGPNFVNEVNKLSLALHPEHPSFLIVGGAKFDTKLPMIEKFLGIVDKIFIGGALAHSFWKTRDQEIGISLIDNEVKLPEIVLRSQKIFLPLDIINQNKKNKKLNELDKNDKIVDFGENTFAEILNFLDVSQTIIWNGPLGFYEGGFDWGTKNLIEALGKMTNKTVIVGGGDTVAEIEKVKLTHPNLKFTHVSSAGGAMIDFLSNGTLPGIEAIK